MRAAGDARHLPTDRQHEGCSERPLDERALRHEPWRRAARGGVAEASPAHRRVRHTRRRRAVVDPRALQRPFETSQPMYSMRLFVQSIAIRKLLSAELACCCCHQRHTEARPRRACASAGVSPSPPRSVSPHPRLRCTSLAQGRPCQSRAGSRSSSRRSTSPRPRTVCADPRAQTH